MSDYIQLKYSDISIIKKKLLAKNNRCPLCNKIIPAPEAVLDHQHKNTKDEPNGLNGAGLIRGVLCRDCNCVEGKIWNNLKRFKQHRTKEERIQWLSNLIKYYQQEPLNLIHPTERAKEKTISKRQFNKLCKLVNKQLEFPKSGTLTKPLKVLFDKYNLSPYN